MPEDLTQRVISIIADVQKLPPERVTLDSSFQELGIDSLDGMQIVFALEEAFNVSIPDEPAQNMTGVRQAVEALETLISGRPEAGAAAQL